MLNSIAKDAMRITRCWISIGCTGDRLRNSLVGQWRQTRGQQRGANGAQQRAERQTPHPVQH